MIDLSRGYRVQPKSSTASRSKGYNVRIAIYHCSSNKSNDRIAITFYGEDIFKLFNGHGLIPYIVDNLN